MFQPFLLGFLRAALVVFGFVWSYLIVPLTRVRVVGPIVLGLGGLYVVFVFIPKMLVIVVVLYVVVGALSMFFKKISGRKKPN